MHIQPISNYNQINFTKKLVSRKGSHEQKPDMSKTNSNKAKFLIPTFVVSALAGLSLSPGRLQEDNAPEPTNAVTETYAPEKLGFEPIYDIVLPVNDKFVEQDNKDDYKDATVQDEETETEPVLLDEPQDEVQPEFSVAVSNIQNSPVSQESQDTVEAKYWLNELEQAGGDAYNYFYRLTDCLGFEDDIETMKYLCNMCFSEEWGDGYVNPLYLSAQIMQESEYNEKITAGGTDAEGLLQQTPIAVREINRIYNTNYTYSDRLDGKKSIEMAVLLLKNNAKITGTTGKALGMYYTGQANHSAGTDARNYVSAILSRFDNPPMTTWELLEHRPDIS